MLIQIAHLVFISIIKLFDTSFILSIPYNNYGHKHLCTHMTMKKRRANIIWMPELQFMQVERRKLHQHSMNLKTKRILTASLSRKEKFKCSSTFDELRLMHCVYS